MRERVDNSPNPSPPVKLRPGDRILSQDEAATEEEKRITAACTRETLRRMSGEVASAPGASS